MSSKPPVTGFDAKSRLRGIFTNGSNITQQQQQQWKMTRHNVGNNPCIVIVGESKLLLQQMIDGRLFHLFMLPDWDVKVTVQMASMGIDQCLKLTSRMIDVM